MCHVSLSTKILNFVTLYMYDTHTHIWTNEDMKKILTENQLTLLR